MGYVKHMFCLLIFLSFFSPMPANAGSTVHLRVGVEAPYPPFTDVDKDGKLIGFDVDIAQALCKELGVTCDIKSYSFNLLIPLILEDKLDFVVGSLGASEERKQLVDFTDRYFRSFSIFIGRGHSSLQITVDTIKGMTIGVQAETLQKKYLQNTFGETIDIIQTRTFNELIPLLKNGDVDLVLVDGLAGYAMLKSDIGDGLETVGEPLDSDGVTGWASIAVSKNKPQLRLDINEAIQALRRNGEYSRINRKYFDFNVY